MGELRLPHRHDPHRPNDAEHVLHSYRDSAEGRGAGRMQRPGKDDNELFFVHLHHVGDKQRGLRHQLACSRVAFRIPGHIRHLEVPQAKRWIIRVHRRAGLHRQRRAALYERAVLREHNITQLPERRVQRAPYGRSVRGDGRQHVLACGAHIVGCDNRQAARPPRHQRKPGNGKAHRALPRRWQVEVEPTLRWGT